MSSIPRSRNRNPTYLRGFLKTGEVELFTTDKDIIERAVMARNCPASKAAFVDFDGEEDETVIGRVTAARVDGPRFRFAVMPEGH